MGIADSAKNKAQDLKGQAKEAVGSATDNSDLQPKARSTRPSQR